MARRCELTGKATLTGHLVSHSNRKTKTVFRPNLVNVTLQSGTRGGRSGCASRFGQRPAFGRASWRPRRLPAQGRRLTSRSAPLTPEA